MTSKTQLPYRPETRRYFALALDPIHVGTGSDRLGRVDMSIVREPGTNLPKIPGTTLAGACRTYAAMQEDSKFPGCAGQSGHCGKSECPICVTFGFVGAKQSFQGLAQIFDARLVLFPVHSLAGPVRVTCPAVLCDLDLSLADPPEGEVKVTENLGKNDRLNLGWMMFSAKTDGFTLGTKLDGVKPEILNRAVLVSNELFGQIVNDNLEVRTSVSIDPATGAAADGALFTYEAIPRSAVLAFDVVFNNPKFYCIGGKQPLSGQECAEPPSSSDQGQNGLKTVKQTVEKGLALFEVLGVGGMNTRGMGRLKIVNLQAENTQVPAAEGGKK